MDLRPVALNSLVDCGSDFGKLSLARHVPARCDFIEAFPEGVFQAHAGLVPPDDYRSFGIQRLLQLAFHETTR
jgi:hypothetical protein